MTHTYSAKGSRRWHYYVCAKSCTGSRVAAREIEGFVVDKIRGVGCDPKILVETVRAVQADIQRRKPELIAESNRIAGELCRVVNERRNLVDAVAQAGTAAGTLTTRIGELDTRVAALEKRGCAVRAEVVAIDAEAGNQKDPAHALADFEAIWDQLVIRERCRLLRLLIDQVAFDPKGDVEITYRISGLETFEPDERSNP